VRRSLSVFCEHRASSVPLERCTSCRRFVTCAEAFAGASSTLTCRMHDGPAPSDPDAAFSVGSTMIQEVVCAEPDVPLAEVRALLPAGSDVVPVVSTDGRLRGVVLVQRPLRGPLSELLPMGELMTGTPAVVEESTPLAAALRSMALGRLRRLIVVQSDQRVIGVLRDVDAMLRLARARRE
jgi:CBS domain-containing protein